MTFLIPDGYGTDLIPIEVSRAKHGPYMHPLYESALYDGLLPSQGGFMGVGGGWRMTQPDKPGFAEDGKSFHQNQRFRSGIVASCAVDLVVRNDNGLFKRTFSLNGAQSNPDTSTLKRLLSVSKKHRSPTWEEVSEAPKFQLHCFIRAPRPEPWHLQPINIRGWLSWVTAGRPDPIRYMPWPPPTPEPPTPEPSPIEEIPDMLFIAYPDFPGATSDLPHLVYYKNPGTGPRVERAVNAHYAAAKLLDVPIVPQDSLEQYLDVRRRYGI